MGILLLTFSARERARVWREETGVRFPMLFDEKRNVYRAYGLRRSALRSWAPATLWYYARAVLRGERLRGAGEDPHQLGGDFLVDGRGVVRLAHPSRNPADRPTIEDLFAAIDSMDASARPERRE